MSNYYLTLGNGCQKYNANIILNTYLLILFIL